MPRVSSTRSNTARTVRTTKATKPAAKKTAARKTPAHKSKPVLQVKPVKYTFTKSTLAQELAERANAELGDEIMSAKYAKAFLKALEDLFLGTVHPRGAGTFAIPGILKVVTKKIKARKGGQKKVNALTGKEYITKDKPATVRVRVRAGSKLKQAALL